MSCRDIDPELKMRANGRFECRKPGSGSRPSSPPSYPACAPVHRYASLYFCCAIEGQDNELITLELIHRYVELLDKYFGSVSVPTHLFVPSSPLFYQTLGPFQALPRRFGRGEIGAVRTVINFPF